MHAQRGQATIDYVALLAVLALLLGSATAVAAAGAPGVTNAFMGQVRRALCIVSGRACTAERRLPCVVASKREARHVALTIAVVRLDGDRYVLREKLSDRKVRLTIARRGGAGGEAGEGVRLRLKIRGRTIGSERNANAGSGMVVGTGEVYLADGDAEADAILRALRHSGPLGIGGGGPDPQETFVEGGMRALARLGIGGPAGGASLEGVAETMIGARRNRASGEVTITLSGGSAAWGMLAAIMAGPSGSLDRQATLGLTFDRHHRAIELSVTASGTVAAGTVLPPGLAGPLALGDDKDANMNMTGRRWELGARVDLTDPDVAAAWSAFRDNPASPSAIRALGAIMRTQGHLDVRSYAVSSEADGLAASIAHGAKLGGEYDRMTDRARLLRASTRPPGGVWEQRVDCTAVAT